MISSSVRWPEKYLFAENEAVLGGTNNPKRYAYMGLSVKIHSVSGRKLLIAESLFQSSSLNDSLKFRGRRGISISLSNPGGRAEFIYVIRSTKAEMHT